MEIAVYLGNGAR